MSDRADPFAPGWYVLVTETNDEQDRHTPTGAQGQCEQSAAIMTFWSRLSKLLLPDKVPPDPDEFVELTTVNISLGPMLVARLEGAGIDAHGADTFNPVTQVLSNYQVLVRRRDLDEATELSRDI